MQWNRRNALRATTAALALGLASLGANAQTRLSIAASPVPHAEILEFVKPKLKAQGIDLDIRVFNDYFFAMRRYVPVTLPFTFILAALAAK